MVALEITPGPEHFSGLRVQASQAGRAEGDIKPARFDCRSWRGVSIELVSELRIWNVEQFEVARDFARIAIQAHHEEFAAIFRGRGEPDLVSPDDRTGPCAAMNRGLPFDVAGRLFAPVQRQAGGSGSAIPTRTAELRPVDVRRVETPRRKEYEEEATAADHAG